MKEETKKIIKIVIIILIIILVFHYRKDIRCDFFDHSKNKNTFSIPEDYVFHNEAKEFDSYPTFYDADENYYDEKKEAWCVVVDKKFLNNNDVYVSLSGLLLNTTEKPTIKINGKLVPPKEINISEYGETHLFDEIYISKKYYFFIEDTIEENKVYEFYVRLGRKTKTENIIFTSKGNPEDDFD